MHFNFRQLQSQVQLSGSTSLPPAKKRLRLGRVHTPSCEFLEAISALVAKPGTLETLSRIHEDTLPQTQPGNVGRDNQNQTSRLQALLNWVDPSDESCGKVFSPVKCPPLADAGHGTRVDGDPHPDTSDQMCISNTGPNSHPTQEHLCASHVRACAEVPHGLQVWSRSTSSF